MQRPAHEPHVIINPVEQTMSDIPTLRNGVTPYLTVHGASEASAWYQRAFGAQELMRQADQDGTRLIHCHLRINDADVMMSDDYPEHGFGLPEGGPAGVTLHLHVDDADTWWERAVAAGATITMPIADQFWGDRYGQVRDPYGHTWSIGSSKKS
jgi:PhnB protein